MLAIVPFVMPAVVVATAFSALLGPRFIASAFASGPALIILVLQLIRRVTDRLTAIVDSDNPELVFTMRPSTSPPCSPRAEPRPSSSRQSSSRSQRTG